MDGRPTNTSVEITGLLLHPGGPLLPSTCFDTVARPGTTRHRSCAPLALVSHRPWICPWFNYPPPVVNFQPSLILECDRVACGPRPKLRACVWLLMMSLVSRHDRSVPPPCHQVELNVTVHHETIPSTSRDLAESKSRHRHTL